MDFHHIGVASKSIKKSLIVYESMGYSLLNNKIVIDNIQKVKLCILHKESHPLIELVEPNHDKSPVSRILKTNGAIPYHTCYEVDDILTTINKFKSNGFRLITPPVQAILFDNRLVCFLYNNDIGTIELLEK